VIAIGVPGTAQPAFALDAGGPLTDQQIEVLVRGIEDRWRRPGAAVLPEIAGVRQRLGELTVPTLILVGRHDFITSPAQSYIIKRAYRPTELHILKRSGHFPWLEEPQLAFNAIASFIVKITNQTESQEV
jgi:pimeloyl-ACP methyl ester carboxylesterase